MNVDNYLVHDARERKFPVAAETAIYCGSKADRQVTLIEGRFIRMRTLHRMHMEWQVRQFSVIKPASRKDGSVGE